MAGGEANPPDDQRSGHSHSIPAVYSINRGLLSAATISFEFVKYSSIQSHPLVQLHKPVNINIHQDPKCLGKELFSLSSISWNCKGEGEVVPRSMSSSGRRVRFIAVLSSSAQSHGEE